MSHDHGDRFGEVVRLDDALAALADLVEPHGRTEVVPVADAVDRALAESVDAARDVPHYDRAAMDGYALRATETHDASERTPRTFDLTDAALGPGEARPVHTGSAVPTGADAVVPVEATRERDGRIEVPTRLAVGENVAPAGEDVAAGDRLFDPGHRLRPADLALCRVAGVETVEVADRPRVAVAPTGDELVESDPDPGEVVETNGLMVSRLVEGWGGDATDGSVVPDDEDAIRGAIEDGLDHDLVVTLGGSSVGERDLVPDVVDDVGEMVIHGVAIQPGHPVGFGAVEATPVLVLPGYPVSCLVTAVQLLRPATAWSAGLEPASFPTRRGRLTRSIASEPGVRTFARVRFPDVQGDGQESTDRLDPADEPNVAPLRASGAGVLSSVAFADGWVVVPESREGYEAGTVVDVERWDATR